MSRVEHYLHENAADGMNGIVAIEAFIHQPTKRSGYWRRFPQRNLVFDHHMSDRVRLGGFKLNPGATMIFNHQFEPFRFIEFEPDDRIGLLICVVLHGKSRAPAFQNIR